MDIERIYTKLVDNRREIDQSLDAGDRRRFTMFYRQRRLLLARLRRHAEAASIAELGDT